MKISRYGASRDDFGFFVKPGCNTTINSVYTIEQCELNAVDGDCKELAKEYDKYQLIANMNKCAADIAYQSVLAGFLFEKITIIGMLLDHKQEKVVKTYKLEFCFQQRKEI